MDRRAVWPDFDRRRVLHEDDALLAIDKPAGVSSQAASDDAADDVVARLRAFLAARETPAGDVYLGVHQRLDRATSGVLVYTRRREANRALAEQFESRRVDKRYVACVAAWPHGRGGTTLRHRLAPGRDGRMEVVGPRDRRGQEAITHAETIERGGDGRALVELRLETGRTHQARAQLAAVGTPIAGDRMYARGGESDARAAAPRLLLHARAIALRHPIDGNALSIEAPTPRAFERWLREGDVSPLADGAALADTLDLARESRFALGRAAGTTAFRLANEGGDGVPGVAIDVYGDHLVVNLYGEEAIAAENAILEAADELGFDGVYVKRRPKQANTLVDTRTDALAPSAPRRGRAAPEEIEIREHDLPHLVRLGDGLSTGIFLDQRENRRRVRILAAGKRVLNLFAYTGAFTLAAARGGASRTISVDASRGSLDRAARGLAHAGLVGDHHAMVCEDVFAWIERARRARDRFDLVLLDPPSYSSVGAKRFSTASDYRALAARAMHLVAPDGLLMACSNHRQTVRAKLRRWLHEAARDAGRVVVQMKDLPPPVDFPASWGSEPHLKSVLVKLG